MRTAQRSSSKIIDNAFKNLRANNPRALSKLERNKRTNMAVSLRYKRLSTTTPEVRKVEAARGIVKRANLKVAANESHKVKLEARNTRRVARKALLAKKKAAGTLKPREFVPKEKRAHRTKSKPTTPYVSKIVQFRRTRDAERKTIREKNVTNEKAIVKNKVERLAATKAGKAVPVKFAGRKTHPTKKQIAK